MRFSPGCQCCVTGPCCHGPENNAVSGSIPASLFVEVTAVDAACSGTFSVGQTFEVPFLDTMSDQVRYKLDQGAASPICGRYLGIVLLCTEGVTPDGQYSITVFFDGSDPFGSDDIRMTGVNVQDCSDPINATVVLSDTGLTICCTGVSETITVAVTE